MADVKKTLKQMIKAGLYWGLPRGVAVFGMNRLKKYRQNRKIAGMKFVQNNLKYKNCHKGERCFILATGPSINQQDLTLLKGETCFAVSNFFVHKDYHVIRPKYYCVPKLCMPPMTEEDGVRWFREMETKTGQAIMFLAYGDKALIERKGLFINRQVHYLYFGGNWDDVDGTGVDLTRPVPGPQSSPVMALEIAIFMGFKCIYLLGCDHDWILHYGTSVHFYDESEHVVMSRPGFTEWTDLEDEFRSYWTLWKQYKRLKQCVEARGVTIHNATAGGLLDVFPRVRYDSLFVEGDKG